MNKIIYRRTNWVTYIIFLIIIFSPLSTTAAEETKNGTLSIVVENDLFNSDRYYTNGVSASWLAAMGRRPDWAMAAANKIPFFPKEAKVRANYSFGQNMYTPTDISEKEPPTDDRPYAGWVYGSVGIIAEAGCWLDQLELTVGMVGPVSLAEETQKFVHKVIDSPKPQGWDNQLKNEPGVILMYQRSWRNMDPKSFLGNEFDVTPHIGGALGNIYTYANTGVTLRYGNKLLLDYGPARIQPSMPGSGFFIRQEKFRWYVFSGIEGRAVARNIFLDGNTFSNSRSVDKEQLVGDLQYGIVLTRKNVRLSFTRVIRTKEFKKQNGLSQAFGAVTLSIQL